MIRVFRSFVFGAAFLLIGINGAWAVSFANLQVVEGNILINRGSGFEPAVGVVGLNAGDRIMAGKNASAVLRYATCSIVIKSGSVVTVAKSSPCVAGQISNVSVDEDAIFGPFIPPFVIPAEMAGGFGGLVGLDKLLTSAPASN